MKLERYFNGFHLLSALDESGLIYKGVKQSQAITRGRVVGYSSGYVQQVTSLQGAALAGIAAKSNTAGEASADGAIDCGLIPLLSKHRFSVPVEANALITVAAIGTIIDLQSANTVDISDLVTLGYGFHVDDIDVSDEAVDANTYGFAIGHFEYVAAS